MRLVIILLTFLPDIYIWYHFLRNASPLIQTVWFLPFLIVTALVFLLMSPYSEPWMFRIMALLMIGCYVPKLFFLIPSFLGWALRWLTPVAWHIGNGVGIVSAVSIFTIACYGMSFGWKKLTVHAETLTFKNLPESFDGYRIVHISDMHIGTFTADPSMVGEIVSTVNGLHGDMVCFTGDLVNSSPSELTPYLDTLRTMTATDGIYSIMGNHDYCIHGARKSPSQHKAEIQKVMEAERSLGWHLLLNDNRFVHRGIDSIAVIGVENASKPPFPDYSDLRKAMIGVDKGQQPFSILLSHDPTHWRREVLPTTEIPLQLSGHTHATQFRLFGFSPSSLFYDEYGGLYEEKDRKLFISTGVGCNVAFRFGVWPEIVVLTLRKAR